MSLTPEQQQQLNQLDSRSARKLAIERLKSRGGQTTTCPQCGKEIAVPPHLADKKLIHQRCQNDETLRRNEKRHMDELEACDNPERRFDLTNWLRNVRQELASRQSDMAQAEKEQQA